MTKFKRGYTPSLLPLRFQSLSPFEKGKRVSRKLGLFIPLHALVVKPLSRREISLEGEFLEGTVPIFISLLGLIFGLFERGSIQRGLHPLSSYSPLQP
ncbi:MAG: hypothetical protein N2506_04810, partial [Dehalococcoidales bacterium]|nr:hypothetical protein [Dehalococcoidales bacterium]